MALIYCRACGAQISEIAKTCPKCGHPNSLETNTQIISKNNASSNRVVAAMLAIFLGTFGLHKFYLGKTLQGLLYLFLFWTMIPTILGFIEGLVYLSNSDEVFADKYR